jgi:hypothetical protein
MGRSRSTPWPQAEAMLRKAGRESAAIEMYADAFRRIGRPSNASAGFFAASNYYRVGARYATLLEKSGRKAEGETVRRMIERGVEKR